MLEQRGARVTVPRQRDHDLRDPQATREFFRCAQPEIVFHLAARVGGIVANIRQPVEFLEDTALLNLNVLREAFQSGVRKLITVGSICCYPRGCPTPLRETSLWQGYPEETNAPYAVAKLMALTQLQAYRQQHGWNGIYLIPGNLYGPRDHFDPPVSHVVPSLLVKARQAIARRDKSLTIWGSGEPRRDFTYVEEAAAAFILAAEHYDEPEPLNMGSGRATTIRELAETIVRLTGFEGELVFDRQMPDGERERLLDSSRAAERLGYQPRVNLEEGLRRTLAWMDEAGVT